MIVQAPENSPTTTFGISNMKQLKYELEYTLNVQNISNEEIYNFLTTPGAYRNSFLSTLTTKATEQAGIIKLSV